jgi:hypothetical protein
MSAIISGRAPSASACSKKNSDLGLCKIANAHIECRSLVGSRYQAKLRFHDRGPSKQIPSILLIAQYAGKAVKYQHVTDTALHQRAAKGE